MLSILNRQQTHSPPTISSPPTAAPTPADISAAVLRVSTLNTASPLSHEEMHHLSAIASFIPQAERATFLYRLLGQFMLALSLANQTHQVAFDWAERMGIDPAATNKIQAQITEALERLHPQTSKLPSSPPTLPSLKSGLEDEEKKDPGFLMADAFCRNRIDGISFIAPSISSIRHQVYIFSKPPEVGFNSISKAIAEALSHAGFDPELKPVFRPLPNNKFELHIQKPKSEWISARLLSYIGGEEVQQLMRLGRQKRLSEEEILLDSLELVAKKIQSNIPGDRPLQGIFAPFAVDLSNKSTDLNLTTGSLIVGAPGTGKSTAVKTILTSLFLSFPPSDFQYVPFDFKEGLTLSFFDGCPHAWRDMATTDDVKSCFGILQELKQEHQRRAKAIAGRCEDIFQYNYDNSSTKFPFILVVLEEVAALKRQAKAEGIETQVMDLLFEAVSQWRGTGIAILATTQYGKSETGLSPEVRDCFGSKVAFRNGDNAASLIFSDSSWVAQVPRLSGSGDCIVNQDGSYSHLQGFDMGTALLKQVLPLIPRLYPESQATQNLNDLWG